MAYSRILVGIDGSEASLRAFDFAARLAHDQEAVLDVVSVIDLDQLAFIDFHMFTDSQLDSIQKRARTRVIDDFVSRLPDDMPPPELHILRGPVVKTLVRRVEDTEPDVVVVGRHGKNVVERFVEGSVSRKMAQRCAVPVVVVP